MMEFYTAHAAVRHDVRSISKSVQRYQLHGDLADYEGLYSATCM